MRFPFTLPLIAALIAAPPGAAPGPGTDMTFVVLGHLRGDGHGLNHKAAEVLAEVRRARPDAVFLTGDIIWGDYNNKHTDSAAVEAEWNQVDSALATLGVPVYRVPGNHDINDGVTRNIWNRRYGALPQVVTIHGNRFLLIASGWVPEPGDTGKALYIRGKDLDPKQVAFLREQLAQPNPSGHSFVVMHHLLWWEADTASWWREVHPLLAGAKVSMVFSGDYGPMKFSALARDGVQYVQSSIEDSVPVVMQRNRMPSRLLSSQFDNFLVVTTRGPEVSTDIRTVAALSSGQFTPSRWHDINVIPPKRPKQSLLQRVWEQIGSPKRLATLLVAIGGIFGAGVMLGRWKSGR